MGLSEGEIGQIVELLYKRLRDGEGKKEGGGDNAGGAGASGDAGGERGSGNNGDGSKVKDGDVDANKTNGKKSKKGKKKKETIACDDGGEFTLVPIKRKAAKKQINNNSKPTTKANANPDCDNNIDTNEPVEQPSVDDSKHIALRAVDWPVQIGKDARHARDIGGVAFVPAAKYEEAVMVSDKARAFMVVTAYPPKTQLPVTKRTVPVVQGGRTVCKTVYVTHVGKATEEPAALDTPVKTQIRFQNGTAVYRMAVWEAHSGDAWTKMRCAADKAKDAFHAWVGRHVQEIPKDWVFAVQLVGKGRIEAKVRVSRSKAAQLLSQSGQEGIFTASWERNEPVVWLKSTLKYEEALSEAKRRSLVMGLAAKEKTIGYRVGTEEERASLQKALGEAAVTRDTRRRFVLRGLPYGISQEQVGEMVEVMGWDAQVINVRANDALVAAEEEPDSRVVDLDGMMVRVDDFAPKPTNVQRAAQWSYLAVASGTTEQRQQTQKGPVPTPAQPAKDQQAEISALRDENRALKEQLQRLEAQLASITKMLAGMKGPDSEVKDAKDQDVAMEEDPQWECNHQWGKLTFPHEWECHKCEATKNKGTVQYACAECKATVCPECKKAKH